MACPRRYEYAILKGWRSSGVDVEFGGMFASALEAGWKVRAAGGSRDEAQLESLRVALELSWGPNGPWGGMYATQWKCTGLDAEGLPVPFKNAKGNKAKCPYSHKHAWFDAPGPSTCSCGAMTNTVTRWLPAHSAKDRYGLIRLVCWYWEEQAEGEDGLRVYVFPDGTPAVELSFAFPVGLTTRRSGEPYLLCGHLDTIKTNGVETFPADNKTTGHHPGAAYFAQYTPDIQMDVYDLSTALLYPDLQHSSILIECAQVTSGGADFVAQPLAPRSEAYREELLNELGFWLDQAERFADDDYWPMNRASCYLCAFKKVCAADPSLREHMLKANFVKREWNPLKVR